MNKYLALLPIVANRDWREFPSGDIRDRNGRCPMCALANEISPDFTRREAYWSAAYALGHDEEDGAETIAAAADQRTHALREALKAALGMKP